MPPHARQITTSAAIEAASKSWLAVSRIGAASRRAESNTASLKQTAASITQIDGHLRGSGSAATQTAERADQALAIVSSGRAPEEAVQAMGSISGSAKGIDAVIEELDKFAFQTRVMAINAAVEAAVRGKQVAVSRSSPISFRPLPCTLR